jgi:hypothetical protein
MEGLMRKLLSVLLAACFAFSTLLASPKLRVMDDGRYLQYEDGTPFFYLGDTAWELFHRLNRKEADLYLRNRAEKGFTVIQAVVLAEHGGLDVPNANGDLPLLGDDPTKPNALFFQHVDYIVNRAEELGLVIGMLPSWGSKWKLVGENRLKLFNPENARSYCEYLGKRYRDKPIIWILGGDENIQSPEEAELITAMAEGLRAGDGGNHLITYHPRGPGQSSDYFHNAAWLDFNMSQSSHASKDHDNGLFTDHDYNLTPVKPTLDGEPRYETIPVGFYFANANRLDRFDDFDVRQAAYWSVLAGACGHTYGHNSVWQMYAPDRKPVIWANIPWYESLDHPGALQMGYVRRLFESRPYWRLIPDQSFVLSGPRDGAGKIRAAIAKDGTFAIVYSPTGEKFTVDRRKLTFRRLRESWFDPRYGVAHVVHIADTTAAQTYTPPTQGRGQDWVLVLDDAEAEYPLPGKEKYVPK